MSADEFKYEEAGAYHWSFTYNRRLIRYDPRNHARYDVPLRLIGRRLRMRGSHGLEVGCGDGVLLYKAMLAGGSIVGLDASQSGLRLAQDEIQPRLGRP